MLKFIQISLINAQQQQQEMMMMIMKNSLILIDRKNVEGEREKENEMKFTKFFSINVCVLILCYLLFSVVVINFTKYFDFSTLLYFDTLYKIHYNMTFIQIFNMMMIFFGFSFLL